MDAPYGVLVSAAVTVLAAGVLTALAAGAMADAMRLGAARRRAHLGADGSGRTHGAPGLRAMTSQWTTAWSRCRGSRYASVEQVVTAVCSLAAGALVALAMGSAALGAAAATTAVVVISYQRRAKLDRSMEILRAQLPHLFSSLASSVGAGMSLVQSFVRAAQSCEEPMAGELREVNSAIALGMPLTDALEEFASRARVPELKAVVVGLGVQHTAGGGLVRTLEHASHQMRQSDALRRSLRTHTAQGRMTLLMVTLVPIGLAVLMAVMSDDYLSVFAGTSAGRALLALAIGLEAVGAYFVSRLLRVEV